MQSARNWIVGIAAIGGMAVSAQAAWVSAPADGWQVDYSASSDNLPNASLPAWTSARYTASTAQIVNDSVTSEKTLALDHSSNDPAFTLNNPFGATSGTEITLDTRFRLTDDTRAGTQSQLRYILAVPTGTPNQRYLYLLDFANDQVNYSTAAGARSGVEQLEGDVWTDLRWHIDVASNTAAVYLNGADSPLFTHVGVVTTGAVATVEFGDNTGSVVGKANVSFVRLTNQELVAVPEPASLGLIAAAGLLLKRRRTMA